MSKEKLDIKILAKKMELLDIRVKELEEMNIKQFIHRLESLENDQYMMKDVFTVPEACKFLELSQSQLYKLTSKLKIPHYKPRGKIVYFDKKELLEWVKRNHRQEIQYADEPEEET